MCRNGFTLIELLVVVAIIAIIISVSFPVIASAIGSANSARSATNLRQWAVAMQAYASDNDGAIPRRGQGVQPVQIINRPDDWFNCLPPYMNQPSYMDLVTNGGIPRARDTHSIFIDPSAPSVPGTYFLSYAMNMYLSPWIRPQPHHLLEIQNWGLVVFMAEAPGPYSSTIPSSQGYSVAARHNGRANVSFLDGHVASFSGDYLGCGKGEIEQPDVHWVTGTGGVNQGPVP